MRQLEALAPPAPLVLVPRRQLRHLNSQLREPAATAGARPDLPEVLVHPADAEAAGVVHGQAVEVRSGAGAIVGMLRVDEEIRRGVVSMPHGYAQPNVGNLTSGRVGVDPLTGMVLQSGVPVELAPAS